MRKNGLIWGSILVLGAITIIINKLGLLTGINVFSIVIGSLLTLIIIRSTIKSDFAGILVPLALIAVLFNEELGLTGLILSVAMVELSFIFNMLI